MNDSERDMMLARIDANVGSLKEAYQAHQVNDDEVHKGLGDRLNSLEAARSRQKGAITATTVIVSALWGLVLAIVGALSWSK